MQLDDSLRTTKGDISIILLLNPPAKSHWVVERWLKLGESGQKGFYRYGLKDSIDDAILLNTNYKDNIVNIAPASVKQYEKYKETKPDHYWNMVVGLIPETVIGKVYSNWQIINEIPHEASLRRFGMDFGYSNDPSAIVAIYYYNGGYILDEITYRKGLSNKQLSDILLNQDSQSMVLADSAEPKSIDEIGMYGVNIQPSQKGQGSVNQGIQWVQEQQISVTKRSINIIKEYENYAWKIDKQTGEVLNVPEGIWNHAMDAVRYGLDSFHPVGSDELPPDDTKLFGEGGLY